MDSSNNVGVTLTKEEFDKLVHMLVELPYRMAQPVLAVLGEAKKRCDHPHLVPNPLSDAA